jgi:hypothetical protein
MHHLNARARLIVDVLGDDDPLILVADAPVGAAPRSMFVAAAAAAAKWNVPAAEINVAKGVISHPRSGQRATFSDLAGRSNARARADLGRPQGGEGLEAHRNAPTAIGLARQDHGDGPVRDGRIPQRQIGRTRLVVAFGRTQSLRARCGDGDCRARAARGQRPRGIPVGSARPASTRRGGSSACRREVGMDASPAEG